LSRTLLSFAKLSRLRTDGNYWVVNGLRWQSRSNESSGVTAPPFLAEEWWQAELLGNFGYSLALAAMFVFFSNGMGVVGSIVISVLLTLLLIYACSGP
jgi:hypothetical protein